MDMHGGANIAFPPSLMRVMPMLNKNTSAARGAPVLPPGFLQLKQNTYMRMHPSCPEKQKRGGSVLSRKKNSYTLRIAECSDTPLFCVVGANSGRYTADISISVDARVHRKITFIFVGEVDIRLSLKLAAHSTLSVFPISMGGVCALSGSSSLQCKSAVHITEAYLDGMWQAAVWRHTFKDDSAKATHKSVLLTSKQSVAATSVLTDMQAGGCSVAVSCVGYAMDKSLAAWHSDAIVPATIAGSSVYQHTSLTPVHEKARVWAQPCLSITSEETTAHHGASVGPLSADELRYAMARGLSKEAAKKLIMRARIHKELIDMPPVLSAAVLARCDTMAI